MIFSHSTIGKVLFTASAVSLTLLLSAGAIASPKNERLKAELNMRNYAFWHAISVYMRADTDGDFQLDQAEWRAAKAVLAEKAFTRLDTDSNGELSVEEAAKIKRKRRELADEYGEEIRACVQQLRQEYDGDIAVPKLLTLPLTEELFDSIDTDGSGSISQSEFNAAAGAKADAVFDRIDVDDDLVLKPREIFYALHKIKKVKAAIRHCVKKLDDPIDELDEVLDQ